MKKLIAAVLFAVMLSGSISFSAAPEKTGYIDNSSLMPKYVDDAKVRLDENNTPEWVSSLIIAEANPTTFGKFDNMEPLLKHCSETGINGLWLCPIYDKGGTGNGYSNLGVHTIDPYLTGMLAPDEEWRLLSENEYKKAWLNFKKFVDLAHKYNIRVFLDVISWGTMKTSPLYEEHPYWYLTEDSQWGGYDWDWDNPELADWFVEQLVKIAVDIGVDGYRYDLEPGEAGYEIDARVKSGCLAKGQKLAFFSEIGNERGASYDFAEADIIGPDYVSVQHFESVFLKHNIVDCIKNGTYIGTKYSQEIGDSGQYKYYSHMLSCHDANSYGACGNRLVMGYEAIYAPFIPIWAIGEEFNNSKNGTASNILYMNTLKLEQLSDHKKRSFFEDVKKMIQIRRTYTDIFEYSTGNTRETNICKVAVTGAEELQSYARFNGNRGIMIVPNYNIHNTDSEFKVYVPFADMKLDYYNSYTITDLLTGKEVVSGNAKTVHAFTMKIPYETMGVYIIEAHGNRRLPEEITEETYKEWYNAEVEEPGEEPADNTGAGSSKRKRLIKKIEYIESYLWYIIGGIAAAVVIGGTVFLIIFLKQKRKGGSLK